MKVTRKIAMKIVLRDDNTPYGGTSYHGETLADFMAVGGVRFGSSLKKVNEALVECGIMPITEQEVEDAMKPEYYCPECGEPLEQGQYYYDYESGETYVEHCHNCGCEGVLVVNAETHDYEEKDKLYNKLCEEVGKYGYYALIEKGHRPKIEMIDEPSIRVKSLFMSNDESSPLKVIDENDTCWDGYDYFSIEELEKIFETSKFWK